MEGGWGCREGSGPARHPNQWVVGAAGTTSDGFDRWNPVTCVGQLHVVVVVALWDSIVCALWDSIVCALQVAVTAQRA